VVPDNQEQIIVPVDPGSATLLRKVCRQISAISVIHHEAILSMFDLGVLADWGQEGVILLPNSGNEPLATCIADGYVWEEPIVVPRNQRLGNASPEGVMRARSEDVVAQCASTRIGNPHGIVQQRRQVLFAALQFSHVRMQAHKARLMVRTLSRSR